MRICSGSIVRCPESTPGWTGSPGAPSLPPFAALTGYDAVIRETGRLTEEKPWLDADEIARLDALLRALAVDPNREAVFVCFLPDREKAGGSFVSYRGRVARVDPIQKTILLDTAETFPISAIYDIEQGD